MKPPTQSEDLQYRGGGLLQVLPHNPAEVPVHIFIPNSSLSQVLGTFIGWTSFGS